MSCQNVTAVDGCGGPGSTTSCVYCLTLPLPKPLPKPPLKPQAATKLLTDGAVVAKTKQVPWRAPVLPCKQRPVPPPYRLTKLDVVRACGASGAWWQVVSGDQTVEVQATTHPHVAGAWSSLDWGTNVKQVSRASVGTQKISCRMAGGPPQSVTIDIYDLTALTPSGGSVSGSTVKVYEAAGKALTMTATTSPDEAKVWNHLQWGGVVTTGTGAPGLSAGVAGNEQQVDLSQARDVKVKATLGCSPVLGQKDLETTVHVCKWPTLEVQQIEFTNSEQVYNDGTAQIDKKFDKKWIKGRPDPATNCVTATTQSPLCYVGGQPIQLTVDFNVTVKPTDDEQVSVWGETTCDGIRLEWRQKIAVGAAATKVSMTGASSSALPPGVALRKAFSIDWFMTESDNTTPRKIGTTKHLLYQTLRQPLKNAYWTLLEISCEAADGMTTENKVVETSFVPFTQHTGDNKGYPRKGDGKKMSYYKTGVETAADDTTYTTKGILGSAEATGRCGGWADLLTHMWKMHGITTSVQRWYIRSLSKNLVSNNLRFLVKNCDFSAPSNLPGLYTHQGHKSLKLDGASGQGKTNPQFDFSDHVIVKHNGKLYDPSYGMGPYADDKAYLTAALGGLGTYATPKVEFKTADNTPQHIPGECAAYNRGFADYRLGPQILQDIADDYGVTAQKLLDMDPALKLKRGTVDKVVPGDKVVIPTNPATVVTVKSDTITLDAIAVEHGLTKKKIFEHDRNKALRKLRKKPDAVENGDHVIVSWEMLPDGVWVTGHDL